MAKGLNLIRDELIFKVGQLTAELGFSKSMGQLYAALYLSEKPVSLNELAKVCRMSKGNASINLRRLEKWDAVKKVWGNGDRRDYYEANRNILGFTLNHSERVFLDFWERSGAVLRTVQERIDSLNSANLDEDQKKQSIKFKKNLHELEGLVRKVKVFADNFKLLKSMIK